MGPSPWTCDAWRLASSSMIKVEFKVWASIGHTDRLLYFGLVQPLFGLGRWCAFFANVWFFRKLVTVGAAICYFLAYKSCSVQQWANKTDENKTFGYDGDNTELFCALPYFRGLAIHLPNPKAILFPRVLFAMGMPRFQFPTQRFYLSVMVFINIQAAV